jgi:hypothetical protein
MKKKILVSFVILAVAITAILNMSFNSQRHDLSALVIANVEALAKGEGSTGGCYNDIFYLTCFSWNTYYSCSCDKLQ